MNRLNILIGNAVDNSGWPDMFTGLQVYVQNGDVGLDDDRDAELIAGREHTISIAGSIGYDPNARNVLGTFGDSVVQVDAANVEQAVFRLLDQWGNIPVRGYGGTFQSLADVANGVGFARPS